MSESVDLSAVVPPESAGRRLDQALAALFPQHSRSQLQTWIRAGCVSVDGGRADKPRLRLAGGEVVAVHAELAERVDDEPQAVDLEVLHEDADLAVLAKPAGLVVHPGAGNPDRTLLNGLLHRFPECERLPRAGIVHRLDKDTSGLMVVARSQAAYTGLVEAISAHRVEREYQAVCWGVLTGGATVDAPMGRHPVDRKRMAVRDDGKPAVTHYRLLERFRGHSLIRCILETGRTHQIRVHMAHVRHALLGDPLYGGRLRLPAGASEALTEAIRGFRRQALHAGHLGFRHPVSGESLSFDAPAPEDFRRLVEILREDAAGD